MSDRADAANEVSAAHRVGVLPALYAPLCILITATSVFAAVRHEALLVSAWLEPDAGMRLGAAALIALLLQLVLGVWLAAVQRKRPRHSPARARLLGLSLGGTAHALFAAAAGTILFTQAKAQDLLAGFGVTLAPLAKNALLACTVIAASAAITACVSALASWTLLSERARRRTFVVVDAMLLVAVVGAIAFLPSQPPIDQPRELTLPIVRHTITTAFALRLLVRLLPLSMNLIERIGFQTLVAARHLRAKKSGFLAAISLLSILAVTVSSCALTTTLSVMGGFRNDLKRKILGNNAHIVIDREHKSIEGWAPLVKGAQDTPGVSGASPYVSGEVMLSSATNLATAVLRGIEPDSVGRVNDLPRNLKSGSLEYLSAPEKLLDLPKTPSSSLLSIQSALMNGRDSKVQKPEGKPKPDATGAAHEERLDDLEKKLKELDEFLRADKAGEKPRSRDILPGIIIGQELARALRLYLGDEVNVVAPLGALGPSGPMPKARPFRVAGIFYSGMYEYDMKVTYVSLPTAQRFLNVDDAISGIDVKVDRVDDAPTIANAVRSRLDRKDLRVRDWQELNSRLFGALALEKLAMFIALGIAILVASFCIAGTLTLMVQEKGREVAILKAMGTSDQTIVGVFVIEGGLIGLLGASLGLFLGYMMCFAAAHFGIRMNPEVYYIDRLPVHMDLAEFALTGVSSVLVCLLVTIYPALMASRLRPLEALRYE